LALLVATPAFAQDSGGTSSAAAQREAARLKAQQVREEKKRQEEERKKQEEEQKKQAELQQRREERDRKAEESAAARASAQASAAPPSSAAPPASGSPPGSVTPPASAAPPGSASPANKAAPEAAPADDPNAPPELKELRSSRPDRRKATLEALKRRWGELTTNDRALEELKLHGSRVAYLQRIRVLAEKDKKQKLVVAVDELLTAEEKRHGNAMNALRGGAQ
jgi:hypothetical protein